ncbi:hypothetical protein D3C78_590960 [compost metagenome]
MSQGGRIGRPASRPRYQAHEVPLRGPANPRLHRIPAGEPGRPAPRRRGQVWDYMWRVRGGGRSKADICLQSDGEVSARAACYEHTRLIAGSVENHGPDRSIDCFAALSIEKSDGSAQNMARRHHQNKAKNSLDKNQIIHS